MSTITSMEVTSPANKTESCPVFVIEDRQKVFAFTNVSTVGNEYTVSFWVKNDSASDLSVNGTPIAVTNTWTHHVMTYVATSPDLIFDFKSAGVYYIYHLQLELGNRATDWRPAPEDAESKIANIHVGARNLIRKSSNLIFDSYYFSGELVVTDDGAGNVTVVCGASVSDDGNGNVTMRSSVVATDNGAGNVTMV